jgi:DNA-binding XRE family transcriptional regulator
MEVLRAWIFDRDTPHDFYHELCKFAFTTYELNEILYAIRDQPMPPNVRMLVNQYGSMVSKKMIQARVNKKLSQKDLAKACMLDSKIINDYEKGGCARNGVYISKIKKVLDNF